MACIDGPFPSLTSGLWARGSQSRWYSEATVTSGCQQLREPRVSSPGPGSLDRDFVIFQRPLAHEAHLDGHYAVEHEFRVVD
jgi:hypothetical protein